MSEDDDRFRTTLPLEDLERIEGACRGFKDALRAQRRPRIEDFLAGEQGPARSRLLQELLDLELDYRYSRGNVPAIQEYHARLPGDRELMERTLERASAPRGGGS